MRLEIQPALASSAGGLRVPLRFTLHNDSDQPIHTCLSGGRVVHLWDLDSQHAYTLTQEGKGQPGCEEPVDLAPHGDHSWTEEIAIPAIPAGPAKLVGFTQLVPQGSCQEKDCHPLWLTATYAPFQIREGVAPAQPVDLRTEVNAVGRTASAWTDSSGIQH
jgi:hypothetical protein